MQKPWILLSSGLTPLMNWSRFMCAIKRKTVESYRLFPKNLLLLPPAPSFSSLLVNFLSHSHYTAEFQQVVFAFFIHLELFPPVKISLRGHIVSTSVGLVSVVKILCSQRQWSVLGNLWPPRRQSISYQSTSYHTLLSLASTSLASAGAPPARGRGRDPGPERKQKVT